MKHTTHFSLKQPEGTDPVQVSDLNENAEIIDDALHTLHTQKSNINHQHTSLPDLALSGSPTLNGRPILPVSNPNLLDNWYFGSPVDQKMGYVAPPGTKYYSNTSLATQSGTLAEYTKAQKVTDAYGKVMVGNATYYVPWSSAVRGYVCHGVNTHTIDRWVGFGANVLVKDGFIQLQKKHKEYTMVSQILQIPPESMVTFSALVRAPEGVAIALAMRRYDSVPNQLEIFVGNGDWQLVCIPFVRWRSDTERVDLIIRSSSNVGDTVDIKAAKLEFGGVQTLAYQDENGAWVLSDSPNKDGELRKCQKHHCRTVNDGSGSILLGAAIPHSNSPLSIRVHIPTPTPLRVAPTVTVVGSPSIRYGGATYTLTGTVQDAMLTPDGVDFIAQVQNSLGTTFSDTGYSSPVQLDPGDGFVLDANL